MSEALFTLVREDTLDTTESLDYSSGSMTGQCHDEIQLVDDQGAPCAVLVDEQWNDYDIRHDFGNGNVGIIPNAKSHSMAWEVDWITDATRQKMVRWQMDRARVLFTPGFGRNTELAWRPMASSSTSITDLTGRHTLNITGDATRNLVWDDLTGRNVMRGEFADKQRIVQTPGGAGQVFERATENLADPASPESGDSGWTVTGGTITETHVADGFGHSDCPHSVRFSGTIAAGSTAYITRSIVATGGAGAVNSAVWVKGQFPADSAIYGADPNGVDLTGTDFSSWTRINGYQVNTFSGTASIGFTLGDASTTDTQYLDFEVGPCVATLDISSAQQSQSYPTWQETGAAKTADYLQTSVAFKLPPTGSTSISFYVPPWWTSHTSQTLGFCGPDYSTNVSGNLHIMSYNSNTACRLIYYYSGTGTVYATVAPVAGAINTATVTWSGSSVLLYFNGVLVKSGTTGAYHAISYPDSVGYRIGYSRHYNRGASPFLMLTYRLENEVWSAERIANEHQSLVQPAARGPIMAARGRTYEIASVPSVPQVSSGSTYWSGTIVMRQIGYNSYLSDIVTKEI